MKALKAIYKFGRLYDNETKKRIIIKDDTHVNVELSETALLDSDPNLGKHKQLKKNVDLAKEIYHKYRNDKHNTSYWKILEAKDFLYFQIGIKDEITSKKKDYLTFRLQLLEDLYLRKKETQKLGELNDCQCVIDQCYSDFPFFEKVYAKSLNEARTRIHELYFSLVANPAANAFREYYLDKDCTRAKRLDEYRDKQQKTKPLNLEYEDRFNPKSKSLFE